MVYILERSNTLTLIGLHYKMLIVTIFILSLKPVMFI